MTCSGDLLNPVMNWAGRPCFLCEEQGSPSERSGFGFVRGEQKEQYPSACRRAVRSEGDWSRYKKRVGPSLTVDMSVSR